MMGIRETEQRNYKLLVERLGDICGIPYDETLDSENRILQSFTPVMTDDGVNESLDGEYFFVREPKTGYCVCGHYIENAYSLWYGGETYDVGSTCIRTFVERRWGKEDPVYDEMVRKHKKTEKLMEGAKKSQGGIIADMRLQRMKNLELEMQTKVNIINEMKACNKKLEVENEALLKKQGEDENTIKCLETKLLFAVTGQESLTYENTLRAMKEVEASKKELIQQLAETQMKYNAVLQKLTQWEAWYNANFGGKIAYK